MRNLVSFLVKCIGDNLRRLYWWSVYAEYRDKYDIDPTFLFNGYGILFYGGGEISCGRSSYIGEFSTVQTVPNTVVRIGDGCMIAHNVRIYTQSINASANFFERPISCKCANVVGANSVVTKSIPKDEVWAGVPARHIKRKPINTEKVAISRRLSWENVQDE